ncbi:MAG TPA: O-antigen ligase family protein [Steroidobacteraceae bacterium]|nr:O-antigen ligase family protein [Steroidobacteraceae bacterium]
MRQMRSSMRAGAPPPARGASLHGGAAATSGGGTASLIFLSILFWLIFYQNLPNTLDGMAGKGPVVLANEADRIIKVSMIAMSLYVIASRWLLTCTLARKINLGAAALLVLALLSAAWSIEPSATLLRFVSLITIFMVCFAIALSGWHRRRFQQVAIPPLMAILLVSLVVGMIYPERIIELGTDLSQKNAWHGVTHSKNEFGMMSSIAAIICFNRCLAREGRPYWPIAATAVALTCLILSRSNTSLFATMVAMLSMVLVMRVPIIRRRYSTHVIVAMVVMILLYELVIQDVVPGVHTLLAPVMGLTGKDATFSGRTIIWDIVKQHIQAAPYLGTGYGAYWLGPFPSSPSYIFVSVMFFYPTEAHNGYLDVVNDLGIVGLICLLVFLFWYIRQALQLMRIDRNQGSLYLALLLQQMVMNMSESEWFSRTSTFAVLILASVCLSRGLLEFRSLRHGSH